MTRRRWQLLVFDWDGTLMDSTQAIVRSAQAAIEELGMPGRSDRQILEIIGLGLRESWETLFPGMDDDYERFVDGYRRQFFSAKRQRSLPYPGVRSMLGRLREQGFELAVATGKSRHGLDRDLSRTGLGDLFHSSRTSDEARSKPDPLMLSQLIEELGASPETTLMIGDTDYDLQMAESAGVASVAVLWGAHRRDRLTRCNPLRLFDDLSTLPDWLSESAS